MTCIEEKLIGRISAQLTRAVEEADQAYEFAPSSYTAGVKAGDRPTVTQLSARRIGYRVDHIRAWLDGKRKR